MVFRRRDLTEFRSLLSSLLRQGALPQLGETFSGVPGSYSEGAKRKDTGNFEWQGAEFLLVLLLQVR